MSKTMSLEDLLSELAVDPELYDPDDHYEVYWGDTEDSIIGTSRNALGFYSSMRLCVEPMYFRGDEVGFVSVAKKNRVYRSGLGAETVVELYDDSGCNEKHL